MQRQVRLFRLVAVALFGATLAACNVTISDRAEARDQIKRSFPLSAGGTVVLKSTNGRVDVQATDTTTVEVVIDRIVKAPTDEAAKEGLARFEIAETVAANEIQLDATNRGLGLVLNLSRRADFTVKVPRSTSVTLESTNGDLTVQGITGTFKVETTNGEVRGSSLTGNATVVATNGTVWLDFASLGPKDTRVETTNGMITVTLPKSADAVVSARVTNGAISTSDLDLKVIESSRSRVDGTLGKGGPEVRIQTTNGAVSLRGK